MSVDEATLSTWSFYLFGVVCIIVLASILLKTKWWRTSTGLNVTIVAGWFVFVIALGILATIGLLPEWLRLWARFIIYTSGSIIFMWRVVAIWKWNWNYWAWSKDERVD